MSIHSSSGRVGMQWSEPFAQFDMVFNSQALPWEYQYLEFPEGIGYLGKVFIADVGQIKVLDPAPERPRHLLNVEFLHVCPPLSGPKTGLLAVKPDRQASNASDEI